MSYYVRPERSEAKSKDAILLACLEFIRLMQ